LVLSLKTFSPVGTQNCFLLPVIIQNSPIGLVYALHQSKQNNGRCEHLSIRPIVTDIAFNRGQIVLNKRVGVGKVDEKNTFAALCDLAL